MGPPSVLAGGPPPPASTGLIIPAGTPYLSPALSIGPPASAALAGVMERWVKKNKEDLFRPVAGLRAGLRAVPLSGTKRTKKIPKTEPAQLRIIRGRLVPRVLFLLNPDKPVFLSTIH